MREHSARAIHSRHCHTPEACTDVVLHLPLRYDACLCGWTSLWCCSNMMAAWRALQAPQNLRTRPEVQS